MEAVSSGALVAQRRPLSPLDLLTTGAALGLALALVYSQVFFVQAFHPALTVFAVLLVCAGLAVRLPWRWAPIPAALLASLVFVLNSDAVVHDLTHPEAGHGFRFMVVAVALSAAGLCAGVASTIERFRGAPATRAAATYPALAALLGLCAGAMLIGALAKPAAPAVALEVLSALSAVTSPGMRFDQTELRAQAGETVALRFSNTHNVPHSFDVDALNVHVPAAPGQDGLVLFVPQEPGTYEFYCGIPGHRESGMVGTLVVEPAQ